MKMLDPDASGDSIGIDAAREVKNFLMAEAEHERAAHAHHR